jgi:hypothetical protein
MMDSLYEVGEGAVSEVGNIGYTLLEPCDRSSGFVTEKGGGHHDPDDVETCGRVPEQSLMA